jgi:hypothetical protein
VKFTCDGSAADARGTETVTAATPSDMVSTAKIATRAIVRFRARRGVPDLIPIMKNLPQLRAPARSPPPPGRVSWMN